MRKILAIAPTYLKKSVAPASEQPDRSKHLPMGTVYEVEFVEEGGEGHWLVTLGYGAGKWHIFKHHWKFIEAPQFLTKEQAESIYGRTLTESQFEDLNNCLNQFSITTKPRMRHFLSQTAHESGGFRWLKELATGDAYEYRKDLGNTERGDGRKFKGAGILQLTGRTNYTKLAKATNDPKVLEIGVNYVASKYPCTSAGVWWESNGMNRLIDNGATLNQVTRRVNGGLNGLADRQKYYMKALRVI